MKDLIKKLVQNKGKQDDAIDLFAYERGLKDAMAVLSNRPLTVIVPPIEWGEWAEYANPQDGQYRYSMGGKYMMERNGNHFSIRLFMQHFGGTEEEVIAFIQADAQNAINHYIKDCTIVVKEE